jgi:hypothetical protein
MDQMAFARLESKISKLLAEMRQDLRERPLIREFVLLKSAWIYSGLGDDFQYYYEDHVDLNGQVMILQNYGLIEDISDSKTKRYVISETLADYLGGEPTVLSNVTTDVLREQDLSVNRESKTVSVRKSLYPHTRGKRNRKEQAQRNKTPYSTRDDQVFLLVSEKNFRVLTNEDICNRFGPQLRGFWGKKARPSPNAFRSCLNRIRHYHKLPRSEEIRKNAVNN